MTAPTEEAEEEATVDVDEVQSPLRVSFVLAPHVYDSYTVPVVCIP